MRKYFRDGKDGMLCICIHNTLLCGFPVGKKSLNDYQKDANELIVSGLRDNKNIKFQIYVYSHYIKQMYKRIVEKKYNDYDDFVLLVSCVLALVKLKILDEDEVISIYPNKKKIERMKRERKLKILSVTSLSLNKQFS